MSTSEGVTNLRFVTYSSCPIRLFSEKEGARCSLMLTLFAAKYCFSRISIKNYPILISTMLGNVISNIETNPETTA